MATTGYFLAFSLFASVLASEQSASFYGESYIWVPLKEASRSTNLHLHFKTHRPHGLLLLAAGSKDNMLLEVKAGMVQVSVNLGSGEASVFSSPSVRLDDQQWHEVKVNRTGAILQLMVDGVVQGSTQSPGSFHELNVEDGILLGGLGTYYPNGGFSHLKNFRGCIKDAIYNENNILSAAKKLKSVKNAFEITWVCDNEFSAGLEVPVSFLSETSFVAFSHFHVRERGAFACDFKTRSENAVVLFNSGRGDTKNDFLSLELIDGYPKLLLNSGSGVLEVVLAVAVNDGKWHELDLSISQSTVELRVDDVQNTTRFGGENSHMNLAGHLFVGGLGLKARSHALRLGLESLQDDRSMKGSMLGCVRNIVINSRPYGFREVQVSRHVDSVCRWIFPCSTDPCIDGAECVESGQNFHCVCDQPVCEKEDSGSGGNTIPEQDILDMVAIEPLQVKEGGEVMINTNTIDVIFDYRSYRIREIAIRFRVVVPPVFGRLEVDQGQRQSESFTLLDLLTAKVKYIHDGTDSQTDDVTVEMSISTSSSTELPQKMRGNFEFVLPIKIIPHNDPPKIYLPSGNLIKVLENSKLQLITSIVDVKDPDTKNRDLRYHVHFIRPAKSLFENYNEAGQALTTFTHQDILDGKIWFSHKKDSVIDVRLNITDDSLLKDSVVLRFQMVSLEIKLVNNTGLAVAYMTTNLIHTSNLSATTNVPLLDLELRYRVSKMPRYGQIQRLPHGIEEWTDVDTFTQRHLNKSRIRYLHLSSDFTVTEDEFSFVVSAKETELPEQVFRINFSPVSLQVVNNNRLIIHQVPYAQLKNNSLLVSPEHGQVDLTKLTFTLFRPPKLGAIYVTADNRIFNPLDFDSLKPVETGGNFSQADIDNGKVFFKFDSTGFDRLEDYIDLTGKYPSSTGKMLRIWVEYVPLDTAIRFTNNGLRDVAEGGFKVIDKSRLNLEMDEYKDFQFSLIQPPEHGNVSLYDPRAATVVEPFIDEFSTTDIREGKVVYHHDDSETDRDSFVFAAVPLFKTEKDMPEEIQEFIGTFHISMVMRNDNSPERLVDKVFHVVTDGQKKLTLADLAFTDKDIHYNTSKLQYRRQTIANGEILAAGTNTPVYEFTQKDLEDETLVFKHRGPKYAQAAIFVSDGQFYWTGLFEIQASDPYIELENTTGVTLYREGRAVISAANLSMETNMDFPASAYSFILTQEPMYGTVTVDDEETVEFSYADILAGRVEYSHGGSSAEEDLFRFTVIRGDVQAEGSFPIVIKDDSMLHPPEVIHNEMLTVNEGETVKITDAHLLLQHPSLNQEELVYIIMTPPKHGFLQLKGVPFNVHEPMQFSQGEVTRGLVEYVQTKGVVTEDQFVFDVDSDTRALKNLVFSIEIITKNLPVKAGNLTVKEGGTVTLTTNTLRTLSSQFQRENLIYEVVKIPVHGYIWASDNPTLYNLMFSSSSLAAGKVMYRHDGSESLNDSFSVVASREDGSLKSLWANVTIAVVPVDDQVPRVVVNKGLSVWADSVTLITSDHLHADDPDTSSDHIIFTASPPTNGYLAFLNNTFHKITHFSQLDIDAGRVVFVHKGDSQGEFSFQASDGTNPDIMRTFHVRAHPVVLRMKHIGPLEVFPGMIHPLSNATLLATTTSANFSKPIVFTVVAPKPTKGKLVTMEAGKPLEIRSFTQAEVNSGKVFYQHTSYMATWTQSDSIHFEVTTAYATALTGQVCPVRVSFGNINSENQAMLLGLYQASVVEGSSFLFTRAHFDTTELLQRLHLFDPDITMIFEVRTLPRHGDLILDDDEVTVSTRFTQDDIDSKKLRYVHDGSDSVQDVFSFSVEISREMGGEESPFPQRPLNFSVEVVPVNDQEFKLVTLNPFLRVLQGGEEKLTPENLLTTDPDTPPSDVVYTLLSGPTNGELFLDGYPLSSVKQDTFTQQDINEGAIIFAQNGTSKSGTMHFKVTDGEFPAVYKMLDIYVTPVLVDVSKIRPVELVQSELSVYVSSKFLNVTTNGDRDDLRYEVMVKPKYGRLLLRAQETTQFSQRDVDMDSVVYVMDNLNHGNDSFHCHIYMEDMDVKVKDKTIAIVVKPLVEQLPLIVPAGETVAITQANLDVTELASRTGDNPTFDITIPPKQGQIVRKLRRRRDLTSKPVLKPVERFTFEDIMYVRVFYASNSTNVDGPPVPDKFYYVLHAKNVQPATGKFLINLDEAEDEMMEEDDDEEGADDAEMSGAVSEEDDDTDVGLIVGVVLGVLLVIVIVAVVVVILWRRWQEDEEDGYRENRQLRNKPRPYISGPLQLEQPHVHIEPQQYLPSPGGGEGEDEERCLVRHSMGSNSVNITNNPSHLHYYSPSGSPPPIYDDCKVSPSAESKGEGGDRSRSEGGDRQSGRSSASADLYDWTLMDPELLQHCRTETPVLRENQYWV